MPINIISLTKIVILHFVTKKERKKKKKRCAINLRVPRTDFRNRLQYKSTRA